MIYRLKCNIIYKTKFSDIKTLYNYLRMSDLYLHGRHHHVSTAALNGQTALLSAFRHIRAFCTAVVPELKVQY